MKRLLYFIFILIFISFLPECHAIQANEDKTEYLNIPFFENFNDTKLTENLLKLYENNNDLHAAAIKVNEAERLVKMSFGSELPSIGFTGSIDQTFHSAEEKFGSMSIPDYTQTQFLLPVSMNYEIDIWGKNRLKTKARKKDFENVKQDEKTAYIMLTSAFAIDYYNLIKLDKLIELQSQLIDIENEILDLYNKKFEYGTSNKIEIIENEKILTHLKEELQDYLEKQDVLKNQLNVLLADRDFNEINRINYDDINFTPFIPEEIKLSTLEERPDWVKALNHIEKCGLDVKIAKREFLPKFTITGAIGFNFYNAASKNPFLSNIGVIPDIDLFLGGRKIQFLKFKKDEYKLSLENYEKVILNSIKEVNDALYALKTVNAKSLITDERMKLSFDDLNLTINQEQAGIAQYLDILFKKQAAITANKQDVSNKINEIISMINLYKALGGYNFINETL